MTSINICIPTYQRNDGLTALLESLRVMTPISERAVDVRILVVDNNPDGRAEAVVDTFRSSGFPMPVTYHHETRPGVSHVRNAALALSGEMDFMACVDDDETVSPQWLSELWRVREATGAAVIFGTSPAVYPEGTPQWILDGDYHAYRLGEDDLRDSPGSVANCLIDLATIRQHGLQFETSISEIGGEDTLLFTEMLELGETLANARDAIAYETVPASRVTLNWLLRRWRRTGWTDAMVKYRKRSGLAAKAPAFFDGVIRLGAGLILSVFWFLLGGLRLTPNVVNRLYTLHRGRGMIDFAFGTLIREYGRPEKS